MPSVSEFSGYDDLAANVAASALVPSWLAASSLVQSAGNDDSFDLRGTPVPRTPRYGTSTPA